MKTASTIATMPAVTPKRAMARRSQTTWQSSAQNPETTKKAKNQRSRRRAGYTNVGVLCEGAPDRKQSPAVSDATFADLRAFLDALRRQTRQDFYVVVVDDGSTDESRELLARFYPEAQVIALPENRGLAAAVNTAFEATGGEYVVLLNNDTEVAPRWLEHLIGALERYAEYAFAASKLMLFDRRDHIHSAGDYYRADGVPGNRGVWQRDSARYNVMEEVFGPCAGAAAYRRSALPVVD